MRDGETPCAPLTTTIRDSVRHQENVRAKVPLAFSSRLRYRLSGTAVKDRRSKARLIRDCWPEFRPFVESGYLLKDIWVEWNGKLNVSYRQFTRIVMSLHQNAAELTARHTVPGKETTEKPTTQPRVMANGREIDPFVNLKKTDGKVGFDYKGTRSVDELV